MSYCTNIDCLRPQNSEISRFCNSCGQELLLKQRYRPLAVIGRGGFGRTFLAIDEHLPEQPKCAIKQLCFQEENTEIWHKAVNLFHEEALHLNELKHSQIPKLLAQFEQNKKFYIVEELVDGQTLAQELQQQGVFQEPQIWKILKSLLLTLQFVHSRQVIHRDIKPENIMRRSVRGDLVLIDFGVAKLATNTRQLRTGTIVGSPEYIAPEQMRGKALPASDLYSLGVTCIYLLTNVSPFDLFDITNDCWVWQKHLPANNTVSLHLCEILDKLLQNAVSQRFQSATEVLQTLEEQPKKLLNISNYQTVSTIDYTNLRGLLAKGKWQSADRETWELMSQALAKPRGSYIFSSDVEKIPCPDLQTIDHLWVNSSHGRFGFSVQTLIYKNVNGDYGIFCNQVGWYIYNYTSANSEFDFSLKAPIGHLPSRIWIGGSQPWRYPNALAIKLAACSIS
ncbi:serine/threonine-protein kinase [Nostoc sp. 'Peltigera membranacea cyanobiont' N6]|uniref:serine/threonine-protein kinase n=2 Tax=Nostoc cyanobionts TaxID=3123326 RepID=UPI000CF356FC|nr:serine/threonine-protein kinase [Nostoc sp. 'Peltigera membranacea cyanobiont' N6]AVH63853.1 serine/threonine protein kinase [Nostoc sp. 'Peltigera membranacea cyanobiont' N6]